MAPPLLPLPIDAVLPALVAALRTARSAVLRAPPGAGKTTRVPPALLAAGLAGTGRIVVLEPRRIAARAAAARIAAEQGWQVGREVGYQVRFDRRFGPESRVVFLTEGLLVQWLQNDPFLEGTSIVVFDEFHERSLHVDLALALARRAQIEARPDLKLLVMSATLDPRPLALWLGNSPILDSEGQRFPVAIRYADRIDPRPLDEAVAAAVLQAVAAGRAGPEGSGDVLVFLPGAGEIRRVEERISRPLAAAGIDVVPLYGDLPGERQDAALRGGPRRRVVLATNVAETSVTVEGVSTVVDSGLARAQRFDPHTGLDRLELVRISRASAEQRAGRAGRLGPGSCLRLWTEGEHRSRPAFDPPEIERVDVSGAILQLLAWGEKSPRDFDWYEAPPPRAVDGTLDLLTELGAVDRGGLTSLGRRLAGLPLAPRLARLLVAGADAGGAEVCAVAVALLSERDPWRGAALAGPAGRGETAGSDLLARIDWLRRESAAPADAGGGGGQRRVRQVASQLLSLVSAARSALGSDGSRAEEALLRAVLAAFPDRVARRREAGSDRAVLVGGRGVRLARESVVRAAEFFVALEVDDAALAPRPTGGAARSAAATEGLVRRASAVELEWLLERATEALDVVYEEAKERVVVLRRRRYRDLVLDEVEIPVDGATRGAVEARLAAAASDHLDRALPLAEPAVVSLRTRCGWLRAAMPELALPGCDDADLRLLLPDLVVGRRSFADLRRLPLAAILAGRLTHAQARALDREAPERITVPSGSQVRIDYGAPGSAPVLAVRIQEMFGLAETPRLAAGRVPVLVHLLAPNGRPQQVTQDLASFWRTTYAEVRKELAGRYPKHAWPEDPIGAVPRRRPDRRRGGR